MYDSLIVSIHKVRQFGKQRLTGQDYSSADDSGHDV